MRGIFGIVGLLVTLAIVGLVVQKQLQTSTAMPTVPAVSTVPAVAGSMQPPPRPEPDADK